MHNYEVESDGIKVAGIVVRNFSTIASRVGGSGTLQDNLRRSGTVGISDVDTERLLDIFV